MADAEMRVYLAGAIQSAKDGGTKWRDTLTPKLEELGWRVLDPCKSEANLTDGEITNIKEAKEVLIGWKASGAWELFDDHMEKVRNSDIKMVRSSDLLIVFLDWELRYGGTIVEIHEAFEHKIPIYAVSYDPFKDWNDWVLSEVRKGGRIFPSWASLMEAVENNFKISLKK